MFCSKCGAANRDNANFCKACSASLANAPVVTPVIVGQAQPQVLMVHSAKSPGLAAVLSFFICGLGQIYNGQILKGILMMIVYAISVMLMFVLIGFITTPILWIIGMVDAYQTADRMNMHAVGGPAFLTGNR